MPEKKNSSDIRKNRNGDVKMNNPDKEPLKIAKIIYGNKNLTDCMESVIKLHMER